MHSSNATMKMRTMRFIRAEAAFSEQVRSFLFRKNARPMKQQASRAMQESAANSTDSFSTIDSKAVRAAAIQLAAQNALKSFLLKPYQS